MHIVAVLALDGVMGFELAIPCEVFGNAMAPGQDRRGGELGRPMYDVRVCGSSGASAINGSRQHTFGVVPPHPLHAAFEADTIVVPASSASLTPPEEPVLDLLRDAHARGVRIAAICGGAFVLAAAGLLDGQRVATHWARAEELARRYPAARVDPAVLYIDNGDILTSAGVVAGLDMCLHMVRRDHGAAVAADIARYIVMPPQRSGGQAQFITHTEPTKEGGLQPTLEWLQDNLDRPLTLPEITRHARMSVRTLNRKFREQTGTTPHQWIIRQRLYRAQQLLETTGMTVEQVAHWSGFGTAIALRQQFRRVLHTNPQAYRQAFQSPAATPA